MSLKTLVTHWNRFFFEPRPVTVIALYRILFGLLVLCYGVLLIPDLFNWLGPRGVISLQTAKQLTGGLRIHLLSWLPDHEGSLVAFFSVFMIAAVSLTLGWWTRWSALVVFLGLVSLHHRNILILNSGDTFLRVASFWLIFSPAGCAISLDRLWRIRRGREVAGETVMKAPWAQRCLQVQLALVYLATFLSKAGGAMWVDGTAIYYSSNLQEFYRFPVPYLLGHLWTIKLLTWEALVIEFAMGLLVWIRELRYWVLAGGVLLHLGIEYSMNIPLFAFIMMAAYVLFLEEDDLTSLKIWATRLWRSLSVGGGT